MKILSIDTSCDDTSVAISEGLNIISNVFWSKLKLHESYGGVVPSEARRQHNEFLPIAINEVLKDSQVRLEDLDYVSVTQGPGLAIALESGIEKAIEISQKYNKKLIPINHMIGHIYANLARDKDGIPLSEISDFEFPLLALTISGGHTDLYLMTDHLKFEHIGGTLDDAVGESFDKVGRMLGMGFPAGPKIEEAAKSGDPKRFNFTIPLKDRKDITWSFSGLKTAVLIEILKVTGGYQSNPVKGDFKISDFSNKLTDTDRNDLSFAFQDTAANALILKTSIAIEKYKPKMLVIGGGVIANSYIREAFTELSNKHKIKLVYPKPMWLCTDNAAMIAIAAYFYAKNNFILDDTTKLDRIPSMGINDNLN